jgi:hypothetical protein
MVHHKLNVDAKHVVQFGGKQQKRVAHPADFQPDPFQFLALCSPYSGSVTRFPELTDPPRPSDGSRGRGQRAAATRRHGEGAAHDCSAVPRLEAAQGPLFPFSPTRKFVCTLPLAADLGLLILFCGVKMQSVVN